jgi:hypothetical protein
MRRTSEDCFDQITAGLLDRQRGKVRIIERTFGHDAINGQFELFTDLRNA